MDKLAILGGTKSIPSAIGEKWQRPKALEKNLINQLIDQNELSCPGTGITKKFEEAFAAYVGCKYCIAFSHGTSSLMAAYYASGIGPGDEVITPAVGYICSYSGAMHMGARPVFCDIDPKTLLVDPGGVRKIISSRTRAINIIHLNGRVCDLSEMIALSKEFGIPLVDDASHAHGGSWEGRKLGNFNHITCFSLQGCNPHGKAVSGGEGGVACTNDRSLYQSMLAYCHLHRKGILEELDASRYEELDSEALGLKWRPHPLAMGLASISLASLEVRNIARRDNYLRTLDIVKNFDFIKVPEKNDRAIMGGFYGGIKLIYESSRLSGLTTQQFIQCMQEEGVPIEGPKVGNLEYRRTLFSRGFDLWGRERGPLLGPWHGLESFKPCSSESFPVAEMMDKKVFTLPSFIDVDDVYYYGLEKSLDKLQQQHKAIA